jgi:hypothetical protein
LACNGLAHSAHSEQVQHHQCHAAVRQTPELYQNKISLQAVAEAFKLSLQAVAEAFKSAAVLVAAAPLAGGNRRSSHQPHTTAHQTHKTQRRST